MQTMLPSNELPQATPLPVPDDQKAVLSAVEQTAGGQTSNGQLFSPPAPTTQLFSPSDQVTVEPRTSTAKVLMAFLSVALAVSVFVLVVVVALGKPKERFLPNGSFCCPDEFRMVQKVLNLSADPCEDFYAHVCSRVDAGSSEYLPLIIRVDIRRRSLESAAVGTEASVAGRMLTALKTRFEEEKPPGEDIADFVTAIVQIVGTSQQVTAFRMVRLFAELSLRYGLPSVISFAVSKGETVLLIKRNDGWTSDSRFANFSAVALEATNRALKTSVTIQQLQELDDALRNTKDRNNSETIYRSISISPFSALVKGDWAAVLETLLFPAHPSVATVETQQEDKLDDFLSILASADRQRSVTAYAVSYTALKAHFDIEEAVGSHSMPPVDISCQVLDVCILEDRFFAEVISAGNINERIQFLFSRIRLNVMDQASGHPLFNGTSKEAVAQQLNKLQLMLPEEMAVSDLAAPAVSRTFATNLLAARSYVFEVTKAKVARKIPSTESFFLPAIERRGDVIFLPASLYSLLDQASKRNALDLPLVGVDMSAHMWSYLLNTSWPTEEQKIIEDHLQCFRERHFSNHDNGDILKTVSAALGLASAIDAMLDTERNTIVHIDAAQTSVGRLVYLMWAYDRCATLPELVPDVDINLALRNSPAFGEAFGCPKSSPMSRRLCCFEHC